MENSNDLRFYGPDSSIKVALIANPGLYIEFKESL